MNNRSLPLSDKVVLVTGASQGIGKATALIMAQNGAIVVANYNSSSEEASVLLSALHKINTDCCILKADVSNANEVKVMFRDIFKKFGRIDVLVNNAGVFYESLMVMTSESQFEHLMQANVKGAYLCMQYAAKIMMKRMCGKIINISSIVGVYGARGQVAYSASKAAIVGMTKSASKELAGFGVTVNAVAPGFVDTSLTREYKDGAKEKVVASIGLARVGMPEDVAKVVYFLSSDLADYVTGQVIGVDGGMQV